MTQRYPLHWPDGQPRTPAHLRERSIYKVTQDRAQRDLIRELELMGAKDVVLSTNLRLRNDGLPYANQKRPDDPGVAIYWTTASGTKVGFGCDRFTRIRCNMRALGLTVAALRAIDRAGCTDVLEGAYRGWAQLPATTRAYTRPWHVVLGFDPDATPQRLALRARYRDLARKRHPDHGGSNEQMSELTDAYDRAKKELYG